MLIYCVSLFANVQGLKSKKVNGDGSFLLQEKKPSPEMVGLAFPSVTVTSSLPQSADAIILHYTIS